MEGIKPAVMEKHEFEKKNNLPLLVAFWPSRKVKIPKQTAKASFVEPSSPRKADSFGLTL